MKTPFEKLVGKFDYQAVFAEIKPMESETIECDDAEGILSVVIAADGDVHLALDPHPRSLSICGPSFRARTWMGGGRHEKVRQALLLLALAIKESKRT